VAAVLQSGFGNGLETNSGRKPASLVVDLRGDHRLSTFGHGSRSPSLKVVD
jgi:hypothetical protein